MKIKMPAVIGGFIALAFLAGCEKDSSELTLQQKLVGKWNMKTAIGSYTVQGSKRSDTTSFTASDYFEFRADGVLAISVGNHDYTGMWNVTDGKLHITKTGYIDYANGFDLPVVETNRLQLYYTESNAVSLLEQKLNLSK